ncbi:glycoside hydrolase family 2 protein [Vibrio cionasavignyae]|uniref:glycoside hydrolase family 2 protein n=1 Tax=Vibrio cionasavignyae TaxID=2910252 RepID=UPI003D0B629B
MRFIGWMLICIFLQGCTSQSVVQSISSQNLNGQWQFTSISPSILPYQQSIQVPANWHSEGVSFSGQALYQTSFDLQGYVSGERYWLMFEAVDYAADVSLNNIPLGSHVGYFSPFSFDVTRFVQPKNNELSVVVTSENDDKNADWSLNKREIKGVLNHHDTRPGGAWSDKGQDANSGGIWGSVALKRTGQIAIRDITFIPTIEPNGSTSGIVTIELDSAIDVEATIEISLTSPHDVKAQTRSEKYVITTAVKQGQNTVEWSVPSMKRALWWPYDWGKPSLHDLVVKVSLPKGTLSDSSQQRVGFREVRYSEDDKHFYINGLPYFIRGTNYIASQWLGTVTREDYANDLALMKEANINGIRVHGHVAGKAFYQLADEVGFVVWQDFPLQWGYDDSLSTAVEAARQAVEMTSMLSNHPSIAFWSGHNEPPWDATWMKYKYSTYSPSHNKQLTEAVYSALSKSKDGRVVREASYTNEHPWYGWYSGQYTDYKTLNGTPIISEFGTQAFPSSELLSSFLTDTDTWPLNAEQLSQLDYHNFQLHELKNLAKVDMGKNINELIINSQEYQRVVNKYAAEQLRLKKNNGVAAIYQFMFVDSWPSITWSILDVNREMKPAYQALKESFQPILPVASVKENSSSKLINISVINDSRTDLYNAKIEINCIQANTEQSQCWRGENIKIGQNQVVTIASIEPLKITDDFVINIISEQGKLISSNHYKAGDY